MRENDMPQKLYHIRNKHDAHAYWSNDDGWVGYDDADVFLDSERATMNLPIDGEWI